jgi:hypothetical protein
MMAARAPARLGVGRDGGMAATLGVSLKWLSGLQELIDPCKSMVARSHREGNLERGRSLLEQGPERLADRDEGERGER